VVGAGAGAAGARVVGAGAGAVGVSDAAAVACVFAGCALRVAVAACAACLLAVPVAVAEAVVVKPVVVPLSCEEGDPPEFAATIMMISATEAKTPVSTLCRAGQDLPRGGGGGP
jgi:hypothetical protein